MYLKKIEFNGFKSFATKTTLIIPPGVTAIVGPNGCGKTNVVDAISWVLGEQSAKQLRGYKMEDVIFSGSSSRQAVGMAEVSLTFDNSDGTLPLDFSEITLTRRVFRSGEGQYYINRKLCRLKDINELIMGTGLGNRSYSLVGQGKIDQILQSRPEERRHLLEEAAGISKYRKKRLEAQRKLEHTRNNLLRVDDIIREVKRQLAVAERQTRQAEKYQKMRARLKDLDVTLGVLRLEDIRNLERTSRETKENLKESFQGLHDRAQELETELTSTRTQLRARENLYHESRAEQITLKAEIDKAGHRQTMNTAQADDLERQSVRLEAEVVALEEGLVRNRQTAQDLASELKDISQTNHSREADLKQEEVELAKIRQRLDSAEREVAGFRRQVMELSRQEASLNNEFASVQAGRKELVLRKKKLEVDLARIVDERAELEADRKDIGSSRSQTSEDLEALKKNQLDLKSQLQVLQSELAKLGELKRENELSLREKQSQVELYRDLDLCSAKGGEGLGLVLEEVSGSDNSLAGVLGIIPDFIEVDQGYEQALFAVLGELRYALLVEDRSSAEKVISFLRQRKGGYTVLVIRSEIENAEVLPVTGDLITHLKFQGPLEGVGKFILGDISIASGSYPDSSRMVTREGLFESRPGLLTWTGTDEVSELFSRAARLEELEKQIAELNLKQSKSIQQEEKLTHQVKELGQKIEENGQRLQKQGLDLALAEREEERLGQQLARAGLTIDALRTEITEIEMETSRLSGRKVELEARLSSGPGSGEDLVCQVTDAEKEAQKLAGLTREAEKGVTELRISLASSREREDSIRSRHELLSREIENQSTDVSSRARQAQDNRDRAGQLRDENKELLRQIATWEESLSQGVEKIVKLEEEVKALTQNALNQEKEYQLVRPQLEEAQGRVGEVDVKLAEARLRRDSLSQRLRETYGIELETMEIPEGEFDQEAMSTEVDELRDKMSRMTNVNMAALEDKEVFEARLALLLEQKEDLEAAHLHIEEAIKKINITARERLTATYEIVRTSFKDIFRQLFEGGRSDIILDQEKDILESGLEIVAQPPGKKLQHINLLSGGERAMTTIAFIFALFRVQPSPFYLLDEIDAPLDGLNISRFIQLLKTRSTEAQFLIITHNKQTIAEADVLYGITMEESGVSKVVSVKFSREDMPEGKETEETVVSSEDE